MSGGAAEISVQFTALQHSSETLTAKANQLTNYLQELSQNLSPMKATWTASGSSAGTAADQAEARLRQATTDIINIINAFGQKVQQAHDDQYALEQTNTSYFA